MLSSIINELQYRELVLNLNACPAAFKVFDALFIFIAALKPDYLLNMIGDSAYLLLYSLLK
jgi:hypothetical protein